jgi:hypothetical protein
MHKKSAQNSSLKKLARDDSLRKLSDSNLLARLEKTRGTERAAQHRIVLYLAEVERRKLYLPRGYGSLFEFCTDYLKYSHSSAGRRISAARCIARRQPERRIRDQVRQIFVMSTKPAAPPREGTEPTVVKTSTGSAGCKALFTPTPSAGSKTAQLVDNSIDNNRGFFASVGVGSESLATIGKNGSRSGSEDDLNFIQTDTGLCGTAPAGSVVVERKYKLQFAVEPAFMEMLDRTIFLLSTKYPTGITFEMVFTILMMEYLARHSPENRIKNRNERKKRSSGRKYESAT